MWHRHRRPRPDPRTRRWRNRSRLCWRHSLIVGGFLSIFFTPLFICGKVGHIKTITFWPVFANAMHMSLSVKEYFFSCFVRKLYFFIVLFQPYVPPNRPHYDRCPIRSKPNLHHWNRWNGRMKWWRLGFMVSPLLKPFYLLPGKVPGFSKSKGTGKKNLHCWCGDFIFTYSPSKSPFQPATNANADPDSLPPANQLVDEAPPNNYSLPSWCLNDII